ncbi:MAG: hypothetical protein WCH10_06235 [bacterium]
MKPNSILPITNRKKENSLSALFSIILPSVSLALLREVHPSILQYPSQKTRNINLVVYVLKNDNLHCKILIIAYNNIVILEVE